MRGRILGLIAVVIALASAALATASDHSQRVKSTAARPGEIDRIARMLANPARARRELTARMLGAAAEGPAAPDPPTTSQPTSQPTPPPYRAPLRTRVLAAAVDWPFAYSIATNRSFSDSELPEDTSKLGVRLVRRNVLTGEQSVLLRMRRAIPVALRAGGGQAAVSLIDLRFSRSNARLTTRVIAFDSASSVPATLAADNLSARLERLEDFRICGRLTLLSGISEGGEVIVNRLTSSCTTQGTDSYATETTALGRDGTNRVLDAKPLLNSLFEDRTELSRNHLLHLDSDATNITQVDTATGIESRIWRGSESSVSATQSADGSVAVGSKAISVPTWTVPGRDASHTPLVIFPQGNADQPVIADVGNRRSVAYRFCGGTLYELQSADDVRDPWDGPAVELAESYGGLHFKGRVKVIARDALGGSPRELTTTRKVWVRTIGCDGETLLLASAPRATLRISRYGP